MRSFYSFLFFCLGISLSFGQSVTGTIQHGGLTRQYSVYIPAAYNAANAVPLVLNLHGYSSVNWQQELYSGFNAIADTANFILVYPNGTDDGTGNLYWNVGFFPSGIDDTGFLLALIDTILAQYNINQQRIYSTGMSNGGFMSYLLACQTDRFAAIASVTGSMTTPTLTNCSPSKPIPVMEIHGTADPTVPYNGMTNFTPIPAVVNYWVGINQCNPTPTVTNVPDINLTDSATAEHYVYTGGLNGTTVEHYKIINGAHTWPGSPIVIGTTCMDFSASKEIWRFFSQYSLTTGIENEVNSLFSVYPNPAKDRLFLKTTETKPYIFHIFDLSGRIVQTGEMQNGYKEIGVETLPAGIYQLQIRGENQRFDYRWVKSK